MKVEDQIRQYISGQPEAKRGDIEALHRTILQISPACKLWFLDVLHQIQSLKRYKPGSAGGGDTIRV